MFSINLGDYYNDMGSHLEKKKDHEQRVFVEIKEECCLTTLSLMHRFTETMTSGLTWPEFSFDHFGVEDSKVTVTTPASIPLTRDNLELTCFRFADELERKFGYHGKLPAYFRHMLSRLKYKPKSSAQFPRSLQVFLDHHICLIPYKLREFLADQLFALYKSLVPSSRTEFDKVIATCSINSDWLKLSRSDAIFNDCHKFRNYESSKEHAFRLMRNFGQHYPDNSIVSLLVAFAFFFELLI